MTAELTFSGLFSYDCEDSFKRLPIHLLGDGWSHVHGLLRIEVSGQVLPHMGFFGEDDVCFNTWLEELSRIVQTLSGSEVAEYTFDEGEQGQAAFAFKRRGDLLLVSVVDSEISGAAGEPYYQDVSCSWAAFESAVVTFFSDFRGVLFDQCPAVAEEWWRRHASA